MSTTTTTVGARSVGDLIVLTPHLLGYHPTESLVVYIMRGRRVGPLLRLDLSPGRLSEADDDAVERALTALGGMGSEGLVVAFESWPGQSSAVDQRVREVADELGLELEDTVRVRDGRWRRHVDGEEVGGGPIPAATDVPGVSEFVLRGSAPLASRAEVGELLRGVRGDVHAVAAHLRRLRARSALADLVSPIGHRVRDVDAAFTAWRAVLDPSREPDPATLALAVRALDDVDVRDELVTWLAPEHGPDSKALPDHVRGRAACVLGRRGDVEDREIEQVLTRAVQSTPDPDRAPVLVLLGLCAWSFGDATRAAEAIERALQLDPEHRLGLLLRQLLIACVPPRRHDTGPGSASPDPHASAGLRPRDVGPARGHAAL